MSQSLPLALPNRAVSELVDMLGPGASRSVFDVGCGDGRHAVLLANLGHSVLGVDESEERLKIARIAAENAGVSDRCRFEQMDIRDMGAVGLFDIVICTEVSHLLTPTVSAGMRRSIRAHTRQGGLNVVSGYLVRPEDAATQRNKERCFEPGRLQQEYADQGWIELFYQEDNKPLQVIGRGPSQRQMVSSTASIISQRPWHVGGPLLPGPRAGQ